MIKKLVIALLVLIPGIAFAQFSNYWYPSGSFLTPVTSLFGSLKLTGTATSTATAGWNITAGCFAINSTCIGGSGGSGTVNSSTQGYNAFYKTTGSAVSGTSTIFLDTTTFVGIGATSTPYAKLSIQAGTLDFPATTLFAIGSSTASATTTIFAVLNNGNVGIGVKPINGLDVNGGVAVGSNVAGIYTVPNNGLLINGNISVGNRTNNLLSQITLQQSGVDALGTSTSVIGATYNYTLDLQNPTNTVGSSTGLGFTVSGDFVNRIYGAIGLVRTNSSGSGDLYFQTSGDASKLSEKLRIASGGQIGVATSTPFARFSIQSNPTDQTFSPVLFAIGSSTASATSTLFAIDTNGHILMTNPIAGDSTIKPTVDSCGTSPSITATSTDVRGTVKTGSGSPTACTITFSRAYVDTPTCLVSDGSTAVTIDIGAASTTGVQFSMSAALNSTNIYYWCVQ